MTEELLKRLEAFDGGHQREAYQLIDEAAALIRQLKAENESMRETALTALQRADQFITNGIELGFIRMPDANVPDPAHETPDIIRRAAQSLNQTERDPG
jgi:hypothetical protein